MRPLIERVSDLGGCYARPADEADLVDLIPRLREADRAEVIGYTGGPPELVMRGSVAGSDIALALCTPDHTVHGILGAYEIAPGVAKVWMVLSDEVFNRKHSFLKNSPLFVRLLHAYAPLLTNFVDERNTVHIRWLRWLGFVFLRREFLGPQKLPFLEFVRTPECALPL